MKVKHLLISLIVAAFLSSAISIDRQVEIGQKAPEIERIDGKIINFENTDSKKQTLISFWSPKDPASRIANKELSLEYGENKSEATEFISICTDPDESLMKGVVKIDGLEEKEVFCVTEFTSRLLKDFDVEKAHKAFLISEEGKIISII